MAISKDLKKIEVGVVSTSKERERGKPHGRAANSCNLYCYRQGRGENNLNLILVFAPTC
jgi:hypothetical protein